MNRIPTLLDYASIEVQTALLVKERAKCCRRNRNDKIPLDRECDIDTLKIRKKLSRMMPPRRTWVRPSKRERLKNVENGKNGKGKIGRR